MTHSYPPAIFLFGHQRSGTTLLFRQICASLKARSYDEDNDEAFSNFRLRDGDAINALIVAADRPCVFKTISQTLAFIETIKVVKGARAVLIFRNPLDVVLSSVREFAGKVHSVTHDVAYNFVENRLRDIGIVLPNWEPLDCITERYRGRFSLSGHFASKFALNWLLIHAGLLQRGITEHSTISLIAYEDLLATPGRISQHLANHLGVELSLLPMPQRPTARSFFTESIDIELARECLDMFQVYLDASRRQCAQMCVSRI